jgi:putative DNA primase/helicase
VRKEMNQYKNIPEELKQLPQWVCHRNKIPFNPTTGAPAKAGQPDTWARFEDSVSACSNYDGIGFEFNNNGIVGIDLDHVIADDGSLSDEAVGIVAMLDSYTEYSPGGKGLHIFVKGDIPVDGRKKGFIEMYKAKRYFTVTGNVYGDLKPINERTEQVMQIFNKYFINPVSANSTMKADIENACISKGKDYLHIGLEKDAVFKSLWNGEYQSKKCISESEKDLALMGKLLYWCSGDADTAIEVFKGSPYALVKDDKHTAKLERSDYLQRTAMKAMQGLTSTAILDDEQFIRQQEFSLDDMGNAKRLVFMYGNKIRFSYIKNSWYCWNGKVWQEDETGEINRLADKTVEAMYTEAINLSDQDKRDKLLKHASKTRSIAGRKAMIEGAKHLEGIPVTTADFDRDVWLLNLQNGILDLKSGMIYPHNPDFMITQISNASFNPSATCPRWLDYLDKVTNGNAELIRYMQKAVGYSLTGNTGEECLFILYGTGRNGKGTFAETLLHLLGSYARTAQVDSLMLKSVSANSANPDIARLKGARVVNAAEPQKNARLNESLIKQLTGGDTVTARFLYGKEFEYRPEFKLWINTNYKPQISGNDDGIWSRVKLIPLTVYIPPEKRDPHLKDYLREREIDGILNWALEGLKLWQKEGLEMPETMKSATMDYRSEMDVMQKFLNECTKGKCNSCVRAIDLYKVYAEWCAENGEYTLSNTKFGREISRYLSKKSTKNGLVYVGIELTVALNRAKNDFEEMEYLK